MNPEIPKSCPVKVCVFCLWQIGEHGDDTLAWYVCPSHRKAARRVAREMLAMIGMQ